MSEQEKQDLATDSAWKWADENLSHFKGTSFFARREMLTDFSKHFVKSLNIKKP